MRQQHRALGSIKSANPSQSNPDDSDFNFDSDPIFDLQAPLSHSPSPNSTASSSPEPEWDAMDSVKNQQTKC